MEVTNFLDVSLTSEEKYTDSSDKITVLPAKKYIAKTEVQGIEGYPFCAYFGVVIFDEKDQEIARRIHWLNDFSKEKKDVKVVFEAPENSRYLKIIYRINNEVPLKSTCKYKLVTLIESMVVETNLEAKLDYTLPEDYVLPKMDELSSNEEDILEKNLIWIFSSPRSGSSWLSLQLLSYETKSLNEPQIGMHLGSIQARNKETTIRNIDYFEKDPDYFFSKRYSNTWKFYLRKLILNRIYAQVTDITNKIVLKEPNSSLASDIISECLPNSKMIILMRDGRDVIDSIFDSRKKKSWATTRYNLTPITDDNRFSELKWEIDMWLNVVKILNKVYENHKKDLVHFVRYENLLKDTKNQLKEIYNFIDVDIPEDELKKIVEKYSFENIPADKKGSGKVTRSASPGKWKENFTEEEQKIMQEIMGETLQKFGYE